MQKFLCVHFSNQEENSLSLGMDENKGIMELILPLTQKMVPEIHQHLVNNGLHFS